MVERRMDERNEITKPLDIKTSDGKAGNLMHMCWGIDVSSHGLGMKSNYPLSKGMVLQISLPVEELGIMLPLFAEVAWSLPVRESFRAGARFLM